MSFLISLIGIIVSFYLLARYKNKFNQIYLGLFFVLMIISIWEYIAGEFLFLSGTWLIINIYIIFSFRTLICCLLGIAVFKDITNRG